MDPSIFFMLARHTCLFSYSVLKFLFFISPISSFPLRFHFQLAGLPFFLELGNLSRWAILFAGQSLLGNLHWGNMKASTKASRTKLHVQSFMYKDSTSKASTCGPKFVLVVGCKVFFISCDVNTSKKSDMSAIY